MFPYWTGYISCFWSLCLYALHSAYFLKCSNDSHAISKSDNESVESELLLSAVSDPLRFQKTGCSKLSHEVQKFTDKVYDSELDMLQIFHQSASKKWFTCVPYNQKLQCPVPKPNQNIVKSVVVINIFQTLFYTGKTVQKNG